MFKFYDIDEDYIKYLQTIDSRIPNMHYAKNNKFVCGVVLDIHNTKFYAPISHITKPFRTSFLIYKDNQPISSIRFSFMLPAYDDVLKGKSFKELALIDKYYANIVYNEYIYCLKHLEQIQKKAESVYKIGCNKEHRLNHICCDFKKLEETYLNYKPNK